jgi:hypothetical protein
MPDAEDSEHQRTEGGAPNPDSAVHNPQSALDVPNPESALHTPQSALDVELEQARAALAQAEVERQSAEAAAQQRLAELESRNAELSAAVLDAHRRAVLAENVGHVVPELVQGTTNGEIDASIEMAKAAYARIADAVRSTAQTELSRSSLSMVPPGSSPRGESPTEELSPLQITGALSRNGR